MGYSKSAWHSPQHSGIRSNQGICQDWSSVERGLRWGVELSLPGGVLPLMCMLWPVGGFAAASQAASAEPAGSLSL